VGREVGEIRRSEGVVVQTAHTARYVAPVDELLHLGQMHTGLDFLPGYRVQYVLSHPPQAVEEAVRGVDYGAQKTLGVYVLGILGVLRV